MSKFTSVGLNDLEQCFNRPTSVDARVIVLHGGDTCRVLLDRSLGRPPVAWGKWLLKVIQGHCY